MMGFQQLVVGCTHHQLRTKPRNSLIVENAAERTWREDVGLSIIDVVRGLCLGGEVQHDPLHTLPVHVADDQVDAGLMELLRKVVANMPATLDGHGFSPEVISSPPLFCRGLPGAKYASRRVRRRIAGTVF